MNRTLGYLQASWRGVNRLAQTARDTAQRQLLALAADATPTPTAREEAWEVVQDEDAQSDSDPASSDGGSAAGSRFWFDDPRLPDNGGLFDAEPVAGGYVLPEQEFESDVRSDVRSSSNGDEANQDDDDDGSGSDVEVYFDAREEVSSEGGPDSDGESFVDALSVLREESEGGQLELQLCESFEESRLVEPRAGVAGQGEREEAPGTEGRQIVGTPGPRFGNCDVKEDWEQQQDRPLRLEERRPSESAQHTRRTDTAESTASPGRRSAAHTDYDVVDPKLKEKIAKVKEKRRAGNPSKS